MAVLQPSRPMSPKRTCWPGRLETQMGGNLPFIRPGLNGEVVPKAVLRRLRSGLLRSSPIWPTILGCTSQIQRLGPVFSG
jgi:hypothetical protein